MSVKIYNVGMKNIRLSKDLDIVNWQNSTRFIVEAEKTSVAQNIRASNAVVVTEFEVFDPDDQLIQYTLTPIDMYNSSEGGISRWWNDTIWDKTKLYDGNSAYTTNQNGRTVATVLVSGGSGSIGFGRFLLTLPEGSLPSYFKYWASSAENREPEYLRVYALPNDLEYNRSTHLVNRNNDDLILVWEHFNDYSVTGTNLSFSSLN